MKMPAAFPKVDPTLKEKAFLHSAINQKYRRKIGGTYEHYNYSVSLTHLTQRQNITQGFSGRLGAVNIFAVHFGTIQDVCEKMERKNFAAHQCSEEADKRCETPTLDLKISKIP